MVLFSSNQTFAPSPYVTEVSQDEFFLDGDPRPVHDSLGLNLSPGGLFRQREVLVFDALDLIGNVGGFLGLLLGASVLTLLDGGKAAFDRCAVKKK